MLSTELLSKAFIDRSFDLENQLELTYINRVNDYSDLRDLLNACYPNSTHFPAYYFSPQSCSILARVNGKPVGAITVVQNGALPLPIELSVSIPKRMGYYRFAEITDLCVAPTFPQFQELKLCLIKQALQTIDSYSFLSRFYISDLGAENTKMLEELGLSCLNKLRPRKYCTRKIDTVFYYGSFHGCVHKLSKSVLPNKKQVCDFLQYKTINGLIVNRDLFNTSKENFITPDSFAYLIDNDPEVFNSMQPENLRNLINSYLGRTEILDMLPFSKLPIARTEKRFPVKCEAILLDEALDPISSEVLDVVSVARCGIGFHQEKTCLKKGSIVRLRVEIGNHIMSDVEVKVGAIYQGLVTGRILKKDHYWNRYNQFLENQRLDRAI